MVRIGIKDTFGGSGKPDELLKHFGLTVEDIKAAARAAVAKKSVVAA